MPTNSSVNLKMEVVPLPDLLELINPDAWLLLSDERGLGCE